MSQSYIIKPEIEVLGEYGLFYPYKALVTFYAPPFGFLENFFVFFVNKRATMENKKIIAISINDDFMELLETHMFLHKNNVEFQRLAQRGLILPIQLTSTRDLIDYILKYDDESNYIYVLHSDCYELLSHSKQLGEAIRNLLRKRKKPILITMFVDYTLLQKEEWIPIRYLSDIEFIVHIQEPVNTGEIVVTRVKLGVKPGYKLNFQITNDFIGYQIQLKT